MPAPREKGAGHGKRAGCGRLLRPGQVTCWVPRAKAKPCPCCCVGESAYSEARTSLAAWSVAPRRTSGRPRHYLHGAQ